MANAPPVLPPAPPAAEWEETLGQILHGINPGGIFGHGPPASLPVPKSAGGTGADEPAKTGVPAPAPAAGVLSGEFWQHVLHDLEVYGFLLLLAGIGLYGLFAPQMTVVLPAAGKEKE